MPGRRRKTKRRKRRSQRGGNVWGPLPKEIAWARQVAREYGRRLPQHGGGFMEPPMLPVRPYHHRRRVYTHSLMT